MAINWDSIENDYNKQQYKEYAPLGVHSVKVENITTKDTGRSVAVNFEFQEGDYKYPRATYWLSFKEGANVNWRAHLHKNLMVILGASEDNARKAVEICESKDGKENITKAYEDAYKRLVSRHPATEINVYPDDRQPDKYTRAEFTSRLVPRNSTNKSSNTPFQSTDPFAGAEEVSLSDADIPF